MKRVQLIAIALFLALMGVALLTPLSAGAASAHTDSSHTSHASTSPFTGIPVTGTVANGGTFSGILNITHFAVQNGRLVANGTLSGTLKDALGNVIGTVTNLPVTLPVNPSGTCQILNLTLGPLDLNLLGLMVHLNQVVLNITAQQGPGNLLGNLLCSVAHLLDNGGPLTGLANTLNHILRILG